MTNQQFLDFFYIQYDKVANLSAPGYTPAEIAKKYDLNKFKKVLSDPNADQGSKTTAQLMTDNYLGKLNKLAQVQEGMKKHMGMDHHDPNAPKKAEYGGQLPEAQYGIPEEVQLGKQNVFNASNTYYDEIEENKYHLMVESSGQMTEYQILILGCEIIKTQKWFGYEKLLQSSTL